MQRHSITIAHKQTNKQITGHGEMNSMQINLRPPPLFLKCPLFYLFLSTYKIRQPFRDPNADQTRRPGRIVHFWLLPVLRASINLGLISTFNAQLKRLGVFYWRWSIWNGLKCMCNPRPSMKKTRNSYLSFKYFISYIFVMRSWSSRHAWKLRNLNS